MQDMRLELYDVRRAVITEITSPLLSGVTCSSISHTTKVGRTPDGYPTSLNNTQCVDKYISSWVVRDVGP